MVLFFILPIGKDVYQKLGGDKHKIKKTFFIAH